MRLRLAAAARDAATLLSTLGVDLDEAASGLGQEDQRPESVWGALDRASGGDVTGCVVRGCQNERDCLGLQREGGLVDARARRLIGWAVAAVGVVVALVGGLADQIGIGGEGPNEFGGKQVAALVGGLVVAVVGLVLALSGQRERSTVDTPGDPTAR